MAEDLKPEETIQFFKDVGAAHPCPICRLNSGWDILDQPPEIASLPLLKPNEVNLPFHTVPLIAVTCINCGFVRMHARGFVKYRIKELSKISKKGDSQEGKNDSE